MCVCANVDYTCQRLLASLITVTCGIMWLMWHHMTLCDIIRSYYYYYCSTQMNKNAHLVRASSLLRCRGGLIKDFPKRNRREVPRKRSWCRNMAWQCVAWCHIERFERAYLSEIQPQRHSRWTHRIDSGWEAWTTAPHPWFALACAMKCWARDKSLANQEAFSRNMDKCCTFKATLWETSLSCIKPSSIALSKVCRRSWASSRLTIAQSLQTFWNSSSSKKPLRFAS